MRQRITEHILFRTGKALAPYFTAAGILWAVFGKYQDLRDNVKAFVDGVEAHFEIGTQQLEEQKKTNAKLDTLIQLAGGRGSARHLTGKN